ncbi:SusD/RagB family nutrient-binding outer membrane lipoprotein [Algoriphagus chordae]|uniref:SusD-like starch-binding protein associating with outer membrane n=1 Tax=Algoriphagus chordae TaxID=237019 RepID=A0A2W7RPJ4_9BACT|nr:SusD/RagB family nutrient-binding outer membrane lipoprotein [Algoriphagus chordae]PZX52685.1 SusD-like starch-binding protein associating with outer membrane [Algoriphagus chordae]
MKKYIRTLFLVPIVLLAFACDFGDTNIDPAKLSDVDVALILPSAEAQTARNIGAIAGRISGAIMQHYTGVDAQPEGYSNYIIDQNTMDTFWRFGLYAGAMKDCDDIITRAQNENFPHYEGVAKVLMAQNLAMATNFWGDVPYTQGFQGAELIQVPYDNQEVVYNQILQLLDESITLLSGPNGGRAVGTDDLIFAGDVSKWIKTARSLKIRYLVQLTKRSGSDAWDEINELANTGIIETIADTPTFYFDPNFNNSHPIAGYGLDRPGQLVVGQYMVDLMLEYEDPRFDKVTKLSNDQYLFYDSNDPNLFWAQFDSPQPLITPSEIQFDLAEAALVKGDHEGANMNYRKAIVLSMEFMGIDQEEIDVYLTNVPTISSENSLEGNLENLITQKYMSFYGVSSIEAWNDYRRTGFPAITPPSTASSSLNPSLVIPRRIVYTITEKNTNSEEVNAAIANQNGELMDVDTWIYK